jgi:hypothetical protein
MRFILLVKQNFLNSFYLYQLFFLSVTVNVTGLHGVTYYEGIMFQARKIACDVADPDKGQGSFTVEEGDQFLETMDCEGNAKVDSKFFDVQFFGVILNKGIQLFNKKRRDVSNIHFFFLIRFPSLLYMKDSLEKNLEF